MYKHYRKIKSKKITCLIRMNTNTNTTKNTTLTIGTFF